MTTTSMKSTVFDALFPDPKETLWDMVQNMSLRQLQEFVEAVNLKKQAEGNMTTAARNVVDKPVGRFNRKVDAATVIAALEANPKGLRSDQLQSELSVSRLQLDPALQAALKEGRIKRKGLRRATTYHVE